MLRERIPLSEAATVSAHMKNGLTETVALPRAKATIVQRRPTAFLPDGTPDPASYVQVGEVDEVYNVITTVGRDFLHSQGYGTTGVANGLNYIGLSNDTLTETSASTVLSNEIVANGLSRAQGVYAHTVGTNTSTIDHTFTASGPQSAQKAALFTAGVGGTMNHALAFPQRSLILNDTLQITFTITLG